MSNTQIQPEPQGLTSHAIWMQTRLVDIKQAKQRFIDAGKKIPECWDEEALALELEIEADSTKN